MAYNKLLLSFNEYIQLVSSIILEDYPKTLKALRLEIKQENYYAFSLDLLVILQFITMIIIDKSLKLSKKNTKSFLNKLNEQIVLQVISNRQEVQDTYAKLFEVKMNLYFTIFKKINDESNNENEIILGFSRIVLNDYVKKEKEEVALKKLGMNILECTNNLKKLLNNTRSGQCIFGKPNFIVIKLS